MRTLVEAVKKLDLSDFTDAEEFINFVQVVGNFVETLPPAMQERCHFSVTSISEIGLMINKHGNSFDAIFDPHDGIWVIWFATDKRTNKTVSACNPAKDPGMYDRFRDAAMSVITC